MNTQTLYYFKKYIRTGEKIVLAIIAVVFFMEEIFLKKYSLAVFALSGGVFLAIIIRKFFIIRNELRLQENFIKEQSLKASPESDQALCEPPFRQKITCMFLKRLKWDTCKREARSFFTKADITLREGNMGNAKKLLIQAISMDPDHPDAHFRLGVIYLNDNEPAKAEALFRKLLEIKEDAEYLFKLSESLALQSQTEEALKYALQALELSPKKSSLFAHAGRLCWEMNEKAKAAEYFQKAVELDPRDEACLSRLAEYHREKGDLAQQQDLLRKMLFCRPHDEELKAFIRGAQQ